MIKNLPIKLGRVNLSKQPSIQAKNISNVISKNSNILKMQLLALAALGATAVTSCSKTDVLRVNNENINSIMMIS